MRISTTLSIYIGRHFLVTFLALFVIFLSLILLIDTIELLRRSASLKNVSMTQVFEMAIYKLPHMGQKTFPFAVLFGGMMAFWRLSRSSELVVTRSAGVSAWQFLAPVLLLASLLGVFEVTVFNPLASTLLARYERLEAELFKGQKSALALTGKGLWLRQAGERGQAVVHATRVLQQDQDVELHNVTVFLYEGSDAFAGRLEAQQGSLEDGFWHLRETWVLLPEKTPRFEEEYWLETDLTLGRIQDSFSPPETMSFWDLQSFIETLENAGFSAVRHRLHFHSLLATPLLLAAMILIAATFTLKTSSRRGGTTFVIAGGVMTGFLLYFFSDIVFALGLSDRIPVTLAAWSPSGVTTLLGLAMLLHLEDG